MRLYLLPISTRRTLLYCQKSNLASEKQTWGDWVQSKASRTWAHWEKKESGWQKSVVNYGNQALRRIPYEEWGLKSVPPLTKLRREVELKGEEKVEVVYPKSLLAMEKIPKILNALSTEREALHRKRLIWCFVGMPLTLPIGIIPLIPNLPFFYLCYRAWSHYRALAGGKHIQFLLQNKLLTLTPSPIVDEVYADQEQPLPSTPEPTETETPPSPDAEHFKTIHPSSPNAQVPHPDGETMLLSQANGKKMTQALDIPQLEVELERAIWQVETAVKKSNEEAARSLDGSGSTEPPPAEPTPTPTPVKYAKNDVNMATFKDDCLKVHNDERTAVGLNTLTWSDSLAASAQTWAENMAKNGLRHSGKTGENIASSTYSTKVVSRLLGLWTKEKNHYIVGCKYPSCSSTSAEVGHYTQMVWQSTTQVGCGFAPGYNKGWNYLCCQYYKAGNIRGQYVYPVPTA